MTRDKNKRKKENAEREPSFAVSMEMDELDEKATPKEVKKGESTKVTKLIRDYVD